MLAHRLPQPGLARHGCVIRRRTGAFLSLLPMYVPPMFLACLCTCAHSGKTVQGRGWPVPLPPYDEQHVPMVEANGLLVSLSSLSPRGMLEVSCMLHTRTPQKGRGRGFEHLLCCFNDDHAALGLPPCVCIAIYCQGCERGVEEVGTSPGGGGGGAPPRAVGGGFWAGAFLFFSFFSCHVYALWGGFRRSVDSFRAPVCR